MPEAITFFDVFHVAKLGGKIVDEVHCRAQQDTLGHHARACEPLSGFRRTLQIAAEHLTSRQITRSNSGPETGDPHREITRAWHCY
ncbi:transposase [Kocuria flava]|uniref:transposase n=1 Tax=Kocuria flava TaxID=446860 RepID=UPI003556EF26